MSALGPVVNAAKGEIVRNDFLQPGSLPFLIRQQILDLLIDPRHNIDRECGYPEDITPLIYHLLFERDGIANRVVRVWPEESWALDPVVYEDEDENVQTDFEIAFEEMLRRLNLWWHLERADVLSGIARFGVLLLGIDDGKPYSEPLDGLDARGLPVLNRKGVPVFNGSAVHPGEGYKLLFVRPFDETAVQVLQREVNPQNPRFGKPTRYLLTFRELDITEPAMLGTTAGGMATSQVHWTRVVHIADNREMSEIYGVPRMKPHFNRIVDIRKTMGGSAEMFWKGAFPGISFEMQPGVGVQDGEIDENALKLQLERYSGGLQRYLAVAGLTAKSLAPQISDPKNHVDTQIDHICMGLGIPKRIFLGSERGELASTQDAKAWRMRVSRRRDKYVGPMLIREFINRCLSLGILPMPNLNEQGKTDNFEIFWPDLAIVTDAEKAAVAKTKTDAMAAYISGGVDQLMPPMEYLTMIQDHNREEAEGIVRAAEEWAGTHLQQYPDDGQGNLPPQDRQEGGNQLPEDGQSQGDDYNTSYQGPHIGGDSVGLDVDTAISPQEVMNSELVDNTWSDEARAAALEARKAHAQYHADRYNTATQSQSAKPLHGDAISAVNGGSPMVHSAILKEQGFTHAGGTRYEHANGTTVTVSKGGVKYKSAPVSSELKVKDKTEKEAAKAAGKAARLKEKAAKATGKAQARSEKEKAKEHAKGEKETSRAKAKGEREFTKAKQVHERGKKALRGMAGTALQSGHRDMRVLERALKPAERDEKQAEKEDQKKKTVYVGNKTILYDPDEDEKDEPLAQPKNKKGKLNPKREVGGTPGLFTTISPIAKKGNTVTKADQAAANPLMGDIG